jgi:hypothetical protein
MTEENPMSHMSMILSGLMLMALLVFVAPNIFALNRGHVLRNIALWLAIFLGLSLIYQNFGPDSPHPLFKLPDALVGMQKQVEPSPTPPLNDNEDNKDNSDTGEHGFTPPKE